MNGEKAFDFIVLKEARVVRIQFFITIPLLIIAFILKLVMKNTYIDFIFLIFLCMVTACGMLLLILYIEKRNFLSSPSLEEYCDEIRNHFITDTPNEVITEGYIFKRRTPAHPIKLAEVEWVYRERVVVGQNSKDVIVLRMRNGKKKEMNHRPNLTESDIYKIVKVKNSGVLIGSNAKNRQSYKDKVELYK